ncbi:MAG: M23 family metallopeptidase [Candidatus Schekmanbacteria bacterium]|nr:M23 family metallopeptidase [Candidatus Schekmanbacteria bacterium]
MGNESIDVRAQSSLPGSPLMASQEHESATAGECRAFGARSARSWAGQSGLAFAVAAAVGAILSALGPDCAELAFASSLSAPSQPGPAGAAAYPQPRGTALHPGALERQVTSGCTGCRTQVHVLGKGDTLFSLLVRSGYLSSEDLRTLSASIRNQFDLRQIKAGQRLYLVTAEPPARRGAPPTVPSLRRIGYEIDAENLLTVEVDRRPGAARFRARVSPLHLGERTVSAIGEVSVTLFSAGREAGIPPSLVMDLSDIFSWDIDFATELQKGDRLEVLYTVRERPDQAAQTGRILAARLQTGGTWHDAFLYRSRTGHEDYFDGQGRSLRKAFLKSPLRYRRISSYYTNRRFHPILKTYRPHLGVDYAAPSGTPVSTVGDGRVVFVGRKGGFGKTVIIRHSDMLETLYAHLSAYGPGIRVGARVAQGQMIGRVGATGMASGPHLDFRIYRRGQPIDPLRLELSGGEPVADVAAFAAERSRLLAELSALVAREPAR